MKHTKQHTVILKIDRNKIDQSALRQAAGVLRDGGVIAFPTDTVYGLAACAFNNEARNKIYRLKGRSWRKPLIVMPPDIAALKCLVEISRDAENIMRHFWPGPLTLVLPATPLGRLVMGGRTDLGVRIPDDPVVRELIALAGFPIVTTSANPSGKPSARTGSEVEGYFDGRIDLIIDAGKGAHGKASTVIDMLKFPYVVLREGALPSKLLLAYL